MKVVVTHLGGPCFMSQVLKTICWVRVGGGFKTSVLKIRPGWLAGFRTPVLNPMRLAVGNAWFHESSLESIEIT